MNAANELILGQNIGLLVDELKICTRAELANALGITKEAVGQLIRGQTKGFKPINLVAAARFLRMDTEELVTVELRGKPELVQAASQSVVREPGAPYARSSEAIATTRLHQLLRRIYIAARDGSLTVAGMGIIESAVDLALSRRH